MILKYTLSRQLYKIYKTNGLILLLFLFCFLSLLTSCQKDEIIILNNGENEEIIHRGNTRIEGLNINQFASNSVEQQSAAVFGDYCVMVPRGRSMIYLYDMKNRQMLCNSIMPPATGTDYMGNDLYHSNQASFGVDFYDEKDVFPLLYISQRARLDRRCFVEVYRLIPSKMENEVDFSSITATLVQTIYFPPMDKLNSLGNVNCIIDPGTRQMYTYSRNNDSSDENYGLCKISCFDIPDYNITDVLLENKDIKESFQLNISAIYMQGGCIRNGILFIGQGYLNAGYIYINVVDVKNERLLAQHDLLSMGIKWEPEGCFIYNDKVMITAGTDIWEFHFENESTSIKTVKISKK